MADNPPNSPPEENSAALSPVVTAHSVLIRKSHKAWERIIEAFIYLCGVSAIVFVFGIFLFVFREAYPFLVGRFDLTEFLLSQEWYPDSSSRVRYGAFALFAGTFAVTIGAMGMGIPLGLGAAIFVSEFCSPNVKEFAKVIIEFLAAIPSVVWGFIALMIVNPIIIKVFHVSIGLNVLNASVILALMSVPLIVSIGEDALRSVPDSYREAAEALGATKWEVVWRVLIPAAKNGLFAAVLLGVGRAVGETMAVLMATGHAIHIPTSVFDSVRTLTATIAAELGEAPKGGEHYQALFTIGLFLFLICFGFNLLADLVVKGVRKK